LQTSLLRKQEDMTISLRRLVLSAVLCGCGVLAVATSADAQVVYYNTLRPVVPAPFVAAPYMPAPMVAASPYVANYAPVGNYAAVTAFSPPVVGSAGAVAVTSYYSPAPVYAAPVPEFVTPVTTFYAPAAVAVPMYRRGPFGGLRPVRSAYYIPY
jgi:hypothetical protein